MEESRWQAGDKVKARVRSGLYAGEIVELYGPRAVVKVLAVLKHPEQGDLHHPYNPDVPMFHERKALSYTEKTTVPLRDLAPCAEAIPEYEESLRAAVQAELDKLDSLYRWSAKALELMQGIKQEYKL